ncbi:hypothetical protein [Planktotalea sp.]|uniref:hypothetical protein n=1 Tax=Planktotalea sp. TaxID=2029877 RepID=UPI003D6A8C64
MRVKGVRAKIAALFLAFLPFSASAQQQIAPDLFLDHATGNTLTFSNNRTGTEIGREQFLRRDLSVWVEQSGRCTYGKIEVKGPLLCFKYEDDPRDDNCWMPFMKDKQLLVISRSNFEVQKVSRITSEDLGCPSQPLS